MEIKEKITNLFDKISSIWEKIEHVKYWIKNHFTKDFFRVLKVTLKGEPWGESYMLEMERAKLIEISNYIEKHNRYVDCEYDVRDMRLCIKLIGIILEEKDMFHFNGDILFEPREDGDYELKKTPDFEYVCDVKVNTKNIDRFENREGYKEVLLKYPHELYILKARYLYNKMRYERGIHWCD